MLLEAAIQNNKDRTYRQERHREIQTSDDRELLHTLVLICSCVMLVVDHESTSPSVHLPIVLKMRSIMLSAARRI